MNYGAVCTVRALEVPRLNVEFEFRRSYTSVEIAGYEGENANVTRVNERSFTITGKQWFDIRLTRRARVFRLILHNVGTTHFRGEISTSGYLGALRYRYGATRRANETIRIVNAVTCYS